MVTWQHLAKDNLADLKKRGFSEDEIQSLKSKVEYWASALGPSKTVSKVFTIKGLTIDVEAAADVVYSFAVRA